MATEIMVALLSLCGTGLGSLGGIIAANKLTNYRIGQLEKKVDKHNNIIVRVFELEKENAIQNEKIKEIDERTGGRA